MKHNSKRKLKERLAIAGLDQMDRDQFAIEDDGAYTGDNVAISINDPVNSTTASTEPISKLLRAHLLKA